ncbi:MAG: ABC transporter permease subunit [Oscillibacter sp.]|jgi:ABC-2 type transport system permease protein|nr:ABC transporter permease subunit [Oscillibacter sp.]
MFNMLRMDLRRLFKSRSFYIILGVTAVLLIMVTVMAYTIADPEMMDAMEAQGAEITESDRIMSEYIQNMSQLDLMHETLGSGFLLVMTGIGMTLFVNGDFSSGFIKNICCINPRRRDYVLSKVALAGIYSGIITVLSVLLMLLSPVLIHMYPVPDSISQILRYVLWMWLPHWAFALMALALVLLTRSTTLGIILSLVAGGGLTAALVGMLGRLLRWPPFEQYFLAAVVKGLYTPQSGITQTGVILACTMAWAVLYGVGGLLSMEKRDI